MVVGLFCKILCGLVVATLVTVGILIAVLVTTFKTPELAAEGIYATAGSQPSISLAGISMNYMANLSLINNNPFKLELTQLSAEGAPEGTPNATVVTGETNEHTVFPGDGTKTFFQLPANFAWSLHERGGLAAAQNLMQSCQAANGGQVKMLYTFSAWAKVFGIGPFPVPKMTLPLSHECPPELKSIADHTAVKMLSGFKDWNTKRRANIKARRMERAARKEPQEVAQKSQEVKPSRNETLSLVNIVKKFRK